MLASVEPQPATVASGSVSAPLYTRVFPSTPDATHSDWPPAPRAANEKNGTRLDASLAAPAVALHSNQLRARVRIAVTLAPSAPEKRHTFCGPALHCMAAMFAIVPVQKTSAIRASNAPPENLTWPCASRDSARC